MELSLHVDQILFPKAIIQTRNYILRIYRRVPAHMLSAARTRYICKFSRSLSVLSIF